APRRVATLRAGLHNLVRRLCNFGARTGRRCCRSLARPALAGGGDRDRGGGAGGAAAAATAPGHLRQWTRRAFGVRRRISLAHRRPRLTAIGTSRPRPSSGPHPGLGGLAQSLLWRAKRTWRE